MGVVGLSEAQPWQPVPACEAIWEYLPPYHVPPAQCAESLGFWLNAAADGIIWAAPRENVLSTFSAPCLGADSPSAIW